MRRRSRSLLMVFALGLMWGGSFPCVELALTGFGPVTIAARARVTGRRRTRSLLLHSRPGDPVPYNWEKRDFVAILPRDWPDFACLALAAPELGTDSRDVGVCRSHDGDDSTDDPANGALPDPKRPPGANENNRDPGWFFGGLRTVRPRHDQGYDVQRHRNTCAVCLFECGVRDMPPGRS